MNEVTVKDLCALLDPAKKILVEAGDEFITLKDDVFGPVNRNLLAVFGDFIVERVCCGESHDYYITPKMVPVRKGAQA